MTLSSLGFFFLCISYTLSPGKGFSISTLGRPLTCLNSQQQGKKKTQRFQQTVHQNVQTDRMWKTKKTIEELENKLMQRWGTDLNKWTAQDHFDDDDDDDEDGVLVDGAEETSIFRARQVKDPFAQEKPSKESTMLNKVRKNQARNAGLDFSHLIADQPAGGKGTNQQDDDVDEPPQTGFFFQRPVPAVVDDTFDAADEDESQEENKRDKRPKDLPSPPLLGANGEPLFLTTEQAKRNFEQTLKEMGTDADDDDTADGALLASSGSSSSSWQDLGIHSPVLLDNLNAMDCDKPLPVQIQAVSKILNEDQDVVVGTYTGSGKTLAFLVPLVQRILEQEDLDAKQVQVMVVAPGRELASQIVSVARQLLQGTDLRVMMAIGGTTFARNLEQIRKMKPSIIVGTPGRIAELVLGRPGEKTGRVKLGGLQAIVLDEFDALLQYKAHREPTQGIMGAMANRQRLQRIFCSATASDMLNDGSDKLRRYLRPDFALAMADQDDVLVTSGAAAGDSEKSIPRVSRTVIHGVVHVPHRRIALETLRRILHTEPIPQQVLVFVENSRKVQIVVEKLEKMGIIAAPLHGGAGSEKADRAEVSQALRDGYVGLVVSTELAARGLDAPLLTHVINFDLPTDASHYAHRAGRCGRSGRAGVVINVTTSPQERNVPQKFADKLGIDMYTVEVRNGKLNLVEPAKPVDEM